MTSALDANQYVEMFFGIGSRRRNFLLATPRKFAHLSRHHHRRRRRRRVASYYSILPPPLLLLLIRLRLPVCRPLLCRVGRFHPHAEGTCSAAAVASVACLVPTNAAAAAAALPRVVVFVRSLPSSRFSFWRPSLDARK